MKFIFKKFGMNSFIVLFFVIIGQSQTKSTITSSQTKTWLQCLEELKLQESVKSYGIENFAKMATDIHFFRLLYSKANYTFFIPTDKGI